MNLINQTIDPLRPPLAQPPQHYRSATISAVEQVVAQPRPQPLLSRPEAAKYLNVKPQTLSSWASTRRVSIPMVKVGRRVMYRLSDLEAFCASNLVGASLNLETL